MNKRNSLQILGIVVFAFVLSILLGMMDHETTSFMQLLTGDAGANFIALLLYTLIFVGIIGGITKVITATSKE